MEPIIVEYLAYSGGVQSHCLLEMVLRGHIPRPEHFLVVNADPGMEDERSYAMVKRAKELCAAAGIDFITAKGPRFNLYEQLIMLGGNGRQNLAEQGTAYQGIDWGTMSEEERKQWLGRDRMDLPPFWTKNRETGKKGRIKQRCTREFKIRPMRREVRRWFNAKFPGVSVRASKKKRHINVVGWVGFAADESGRVKDKHKGEVKYISLRYPLIELNMDRPKVEGYYLKHGIIKPPRSVCVACFANGLAHFEDMYLNRPDDWDKAVAVDDAIRNMPHLDMRDEVFVSATLVPLRDMPDRDFLRGTPEGKEHRCNSGVCFV